MHEKINEPIEVLAHFKQDKVVPVCFKWRNKTYRINRVNLVHKERQGNDQIYYFSVSDETNFFRLAFFTRDLGWRIQELYWEG